MMGGIIMGGKSNIDINDFVIILIHLFDYIVLP